MAIEDYDDVVSLWEAAEGVGLSDADSRESTAAYLAHNPGLSFAAHDEGQLVGAVLCGHDGRRGYVHHLAVRRSHRRRGIGRTLADRCLAALRREGIHKCHLFVFSENREAVAFWRKIGWTQRIELVMMSCGVARET